MTRISKMITGMSMCAPAEALLRKHRSATTDCTSLSYASLQCDSLALNMQKGAKCQKDGKKASSVGACKAACCEGKGGSKISDDICKDFNEDKPKAMTGSTKVTVKTSSSFLQSKPKSIDCTSADIFGDAGGSGSSFGWENSADVEDILKTCCEASKSDKSYYNMSPAYR